MARLGFKPHWSDYNNDCSTNHSNTPCVCICVCVFACVCICVCVSVCVWSGWVVYETFGLYGWPSPHSIRETPKCYCLLFDCGVVPGLFSSASNQTKNAMKSWLPLAWLLYERGEEVPTHTTYPSESERKRNRSLPLLWKRGGKDKQILLFCKPIGGFSFLLQFHSLSRVLMDIKLPCTLFLKILKVSKNFTVKTIYYWKRNLSLLWKWWFKCHIKPPSLQFRNINTIS